MTDRQMIVIQTETFGRHFLENEKSKPVTWKKCQDLLLIIKFELSNENCNCVNLTFSTVRFSILKDYFS